MGHRTLGFDRKTSGTKRYQKLIFIATEGEKTEPAYFEYLKSKLQQPLQIQILIIKGGRSESSPDKVLERTQKEIARLKNEGKCISEDEFWIVTDKDNWSDKRLDEVTQWCHDRSKKEIRHFALSNPCFELWYILHFEKNCGLLETPKDCLDKIKKHIPDYEKSKCPSFSRQQIEQAIRNAKNKALDAAIQEDNWPHKPGITTVYRIVERITPYFKKEFQ